MRLCSDPSKRVWPAARFLLFVWILFAQRHDKGMLPSDKPSSLRPAFLLEQVAGRVPPRPRLERLFPTMRVWRFPCRPEPCPSHAGPPVELPELLLLPRLQLEPRGLRPVRTHCGLRRSHRDQTGLGHRKLVLKRPEKYRSPWLLPRRHELWFDSVRIPCGQSPPDFAEVAALPFVGLLDLS